MPRDYHPTADSISDDQLEGMLMDLKTLIGSTVDGFPSHSEFLASSSRASFRR
jgi:tryptophan halogenase